MAKNGDYFYRNGSKFWLYSGTSRSPVLLYPRTFVRNDRKYGTSAWANSLKDNEISFTKPHEMWIKTGSKLSKTGWKFAGYYMPGIIPTPTPTPTPSPTPTFTPTPSPTSVGPTPTPTPPPPTASPTPTPSPTSSPTPTPTQPPPTASPTPTPSPTASPTPTPTPSPTPYVGVGSGIVFVTYE